VPFLGICCRKKLIKGIGGGIEIHNKVTKKITGGKNRLIDRLKYYEITKIF